MITEDHVNFEIAKLLKEKGFDEDDCSGCLEYYGDYKYPSPTFQIVIKWLRQTYKLQIVIYPFDCEDGIFWAYKIFSIQRECLEVNRSDVRIGYDSYEQACEAAIKYCLENLI